MGASTGIEWTDATWNPIRGCSRVSEGCRNCYAEKVAYRFSGPGQPYEGLATKVNGHADWVRSLRDQCQAAGVPFFFKQWGEWLPASHNGGSGDGPERVGKKAAGALLDGREWREFPAYG